MKVIYENSITAVTASSEDASYPDDNVLDDKPTKCWKAASAVVQASLSCSATLSGSVEKYGIAIFNTNATSIVVNISDPNLVNWVDSGWVSVSWPTSTPEASESVIESGAAHALWGEFDGIEGAAQIDLVFSAPETVYAGVVVVGPIYDFGENISYGLQQILRNTSILKELASGEFYHKKRKIANEFTFRSRVTRSDAYQFLDLYKDISFDPVAWRLTDINEANWINYCRFVGEPVATHDTPTHSLINAVLREVL